MLPNFLGIGAPRAGSTWLHELLESHPDVYVPERRKEVHYFDQNYDRGEAWYERMFPSEEDGTSFVAVGEITPHYLYGPETIERIIDMPSVQRLLVILRNPVDRAFSHYRWRIRMDGFRGSFSDFLVQYPEAIEWGQYAQPLQRYFDQFGRENMLVLISEEAFEDVAATRRTTAEFLSVDVARFPTGIGEKRINLSDLPRFPTLFRAARAVGNRLRDYELDWITNLAKQSGLKRALGTSNKSGPTLDLRDRAELHTIFSDDIAELENVLRRRINLWSDANNAPSLSGRGLA